jgi:hypothetical protein
MTAFNLIFSRISTRLNRPGTREGISKCVQISVPVAGLVVCACGIILVLGVVSAGVLSVLAVFIPCVVLGGVAGLWLIVGTLIGSCVFEEDASSQTLGIPSRARVRPSGGTVRRRMEIVARMQHVPSVGSDEDSRTCSICLSETPPDRVILNCGHKFHENCVKEWMSRARFARCPLCRAGLASPLPPLPGDVDVTTETV